MEEQTASATETVTTEQPAPDSAPKPDGHEATTATTATEAAATHGTASQSEESFFDPKELPDELQPAYKQMQKAFVKKTQAIAQDRNRIEAYKAFEADPHGTIKRVAAQLGYQLTQGGQQPEASSSGLENWQPQSWQEVIEKVKEAVSGDQSTQLEPLVGEVKQLRRAQIEKMLDDEIPEWRQYEDEMSSLLQSHPTLVNEPMKLARLAIPDEVQQSKAMQQAMKRLQTKAASAQTSAGSTTRKEPSNRPKGKLTFQQAVEEAKRQIAAGGGVGGPT